MTKPEITEALTLLAERSASALPNGCSPSGLPMFHTMQAVNGRRVAVYVIDARPAVFELDWSTEPLTLAEAAERLAA